MSNKKWNKFDKLVEKCYLNMIGAEKNGGCWLQGYELLMEIIREERQQNPNYGATLEMLEEITDYEYDIQGWLEDCMDEIDMRGNQEALLKMCDDLLSMFSWPEYTGSDIKLRKSATMAALGQKKESAEFCKKWMAKEPQNIIAAVSGVYAFIGVKEFDEAEKFVERFISDKTQCSEENDMMFIAASTLYQVTGRKKEKKIIDKAIKEYEKYLEEHFEAYEYDEEDDDEFSDWDLPFN